MLTDEKGGHEMKRKIVALLLCMAILCSFAVSAHAVSFPDLENHWARSYMEDLAARGYLSGYDDGTMGPDRNITTCEALVFLSRFYRVDETMREWIDADYAAYVQSVVPSTVSWAYSEIELCLAAGIVTERQLEMLNLSSAIEKEILSVFLVRAMKLTAAAGANDGSSLAFVDKDEISTSCVGSAAVLVEAGIIQGDDMNRYDPHRNVTRAVVAAMVVRALDYVKDIGADLTIDAYEGYAKTSGIITEASASSVVLCGFDGVNIRYPVSASAAVTVNGAEKSLGSTYVGCLATVTKEAGIITKVDVTSRAATTYVQGVTSGTGTSTSSKVIFVTPTGGADAVRYTVPETAVITVEGESAELADVPKNEFVTLRFDSGAVTEITVNKCEYEISGVIDQLTYGKTVTMDVIDGSGSIHAFKFDIANLPMVTRGEAKINFDRLAEGDEVLIAVESGVLRSIATEGDDFSLSGELVSVTTTVDGRVWTISSDGATYTLPIRSDAAIYKNDESILITQVVPGDKVTVLTYGGYISEVHVESVAVQSEKVTGTVIASDATAKTITMLVSGKLVYVNAKNASLVSSATANAVRLSQLENNATITVYGKYTTFSQIEADLIVVEK